MKKQITSISIHQSSKVLAFLYFVFSVVFFVPMGFYALFALGIGEALLMLILPFAYLLLVYLVFAVLAWVYNLIAASFGGVEFTLAEVKEKAEE